MYAEYFWVNFFAENPAVLHNEFLERTFAVSFASSLFLTLNSAMPRRKTAGSEH